MEIKEGYVYHIKNDYFELVNDDKLMKNHEGNSTRPNYFCVKMNNEDILWFSDDNGREEFLHPLAIEGFCVQGLKDYQFRKTSRDSFEMYVETMKNADEDKIRAELTGQMRQILESKGLGYVKFYMIFVEKIQPLPGTGKKPLILPEREDVRKRERNIG